MKRYLNSNYTKVSYVDGKETKEEKEFIFTTNLNAYMRTEFLNFVINNICKDIYLCTMRDIIFDYAIIKFFTDYDIEDIENSANTFIAISDLLETTNMVDIVKANADDNVIEELSKAVDLNIQYKTGIKKYDVGESFAKFLDALTHKLSCIDEEKLKIAFDKLVNIQDGLNSDAMIEAYKNSELFNFVREKKEEMEK